MATYNDLRAQLAQAKSYTLAQTAEIDAQRKEIALLRDQKAALERLSVPDDVSNDMAALLAAFRVTRALPDAPPPVVTPPQNIPPAVALVATVITSVAPGAVSLLAVAAVPDGISKVEFYCDNNLIYSTVTAPYEYTYTGIAAGVHNFSAKAYANSGLTATATAQATITQSATQPPQNQPPSASLAAVAIVQTAPGSVNLSVTAADPDGTISKVDLLRGATVIKTFTQGPFTFTDTGLAQGTYSYTAKAYDNQNAVTTTSPAAVVTINPATQQGPITIDPIT